MRWIVVALTATAMACGVEGADVEQVDAEQKMYDIQLSAPVVTSTTTTVDCSEAPAKYSKKCRGPGGGNFESTAGGSPNIHPGDWMPFELRTGTVWATTGERGGLEISLDGGKTVSTYIDGADDFDDITFADELDEDAEGMSSVQVFLTDSEGTMYAGGEIATFGAYGEDLEGKGVR